MGHRVFHDFLCFYLIYFSKCTKMIRINERMALLAVHVTANFSIQIFFIATFFSMKKIRKQEKQEVPSAH